MKPLSDWAPVALTIAGVALVGFIGFLLVSNYMSQVDLQKTTIELLSDEVEKRATAVSYFYAERKSDLENLVASRAIEVFFENRALGMTMEYGLRASLISVSERLSRVIEERRIGGDRIYTRVVFINDSGRLLVDSSSNGSVYDWKGFLTPEGSGAAIIYRHNGKSLMVMASTPYFFKGEYAGQVIAWISSGVVYKHLIKMDGIFSEGIVYIDCGEGHLHLLAGVQIKPAFSELFDPADVKVGEPYRFKSAGIEMLALRVPVKDTPFSMITVLPSSEVFGRASPWYLLLVMGMLSVVILGGSLFVLRTNTRSMVLKARFEEASRRELEIEEKNRQLEKEISMRWQAEEKLKEYSVNLEQMVNDRTKELEETLNHLQQTQSQLLQSEKMASIGQLAAGVAHEINNPTGFVSSNLSTLSDYQSDIISLIKEYRKLIADLKEFMSREKFNASISEQIDHITSLEAEADIDFVLDDVSGLIEESREGAERIKKIVIDLKDFAHPGEDKLKYADINKSLDSTLNVVWNELKYKATVTKDYGEFPEVECYSQQLNQVFMNILVNAAQAIEEKGEIKIATRADDEYVEIKISDTGKGIPEENLSRLFDPFFTTKKVGDGTGLGLNVAYNIVKKHNGTIDVESEVGMGTTFTIRIPA